MEAKIQKVKVPRTDKQKKALGHLRESLEKKYHNLFKAGLNSTAGLSRIKKNSVSFDDFVRLVKAKSYASVSMLNVDDGIQLSDLDKFYNTKTTPRGGYRIHNG